MAKLLLVDDSEMTRRMLRGALEEHGHTIVEAVDGSDGLVKLNDNEGIQLVILDVNMPNMNGVEMCMRMRKDPKFEKVKVFMLTAETNPEMKAKAAAANVSAWIIKPYKIEKVLAAINTVLAR